MDSDGDDFCTDECNEVFRNFKSNLNLKSINGFCNTCGKPHELRKGANEIVQHRHSECYSSTYVPPNETKLKEQEEKLKMIEQEEKEEEAKLKQLEEKSSFLLSNKKLLDSDSHLLICPECATYSVHYYLKNNKWICDYCDSYVDASKSLDVFDLNFADKNKYKIYKFYGIEALIELTDYSWNEAQRFVSKFFEDSCTTKGDQCLYSNYFEEMTLAKKIDAIDRLFIDSIGKCQFLKDEIESFLGEIQDEQYIPDNQKEALIADCIFLNQNLESMLEGLEEFLVPFANVDLSRGQRIYLQENDDNLIAALEESEIEAFCWNDAKEGSAVGVCFFPPNSFDEIKQAFEKIKDNYEEESSKSFFKKLDESNLSSFELQAMNIITENDSYFQNDLWRSLNVDSRKCSRIIQSLLDKDLIVRETAVSNGTRTFRLRANL